MQRGKIKIYTYTRVSTAMQIDGYSLDAQKARMKVFADYNDYEIVGIYEDAGKSGKSIEGRIGFNRKKEDIKSEKTVFPLSLFLSYPDLAEMRRMYFPHCKLCKISG